MTNSLITLLPNKTLSWSSTSSLKTADTSWHVFLSLSLLPSVSPMQALRETRSCSAACCRSDQHTGRQSETMGWNTGFGDGSRSEKGPIEKLHFLYQTMHFRSQRNSQMLKSICITKQNLFTTGKFPNALLRSRSSFTNVLCHSNISGNIPREMFAIMNTTAFNLFTSNRDPTISRVNSRCIIGHKRKTFPANVIRCQRFEERGGSICGASILMPQTFSDISEMKSIKTVHFIVFHMS